MTTQGLLARFGALAANDRHWGLLVAAAGAGSQSVWGGFQGFYNAVVFVSRDSGREWAELQSTCGAISRYLFDLKCKLAPWPDDDHQGALAIAQCLDDAWGQVRATVRAINDYDTVDDWTDAVLHHPAWEVLAFLLGHGMRPPFYATPSQALKPAPAPTPAPEIRRSPMAQLSLIGAPEPIKCRGDRPQQLGLF